MQDDWTRLVMALRDLASELAGANRVVAGQLGLNDSDLAVLDVLHREGPQTPTALVRRARVAPTTMTSVLRRLARTGWVERRHNDDDLRSVTIHPTSVERLTELYRPANEQFAASVDAWSAAEREQLIDFLRNAARVVRARADDLAAAPTGD